VTASVSVFCAETRFLLRAISSLIQIPTTAKKAGCSKRRNIGNNHGRTKEAAPKVGIFFVADGEHLIVDSMPVNQVSGYGGFLIHEADHIL
jgi:hypothetical protein